MNAVIPENSIFLAPMEGVTDDIYRKIIFNEFGGWDFYACDFLRIPSNGNYKDQHIANHFGAYTLATPELREKTYFQILATEKSNISKTLQQIQDLNLNWLDLNLGCPSKKVNGHKGGAYLLEDLGAMSFVVQKIRENFKGHFTCKIRVGYHDDKDFELIIKTLEDLGVEALTIHGRTRDQMYKGIANWDYLKKAVNLASIPIIGNGDIWSPLDIKKMFEYTGCHGVMAARGALKTPWLASLYKNYQKNIEEISNDQDFLLYLRTQNIIKYFRALYNEYKNDLTDEHILKRFKGLSRYLFEDIDNGDFKSSLLRDHSLKSFQSKIETLI